MFDDWQESSPEIHEQNCEGACCIFEWFASLWDDLMVLIGVR